MLRRNRPFPRPRTLILIWSAGLLIIGTLFLLANLGPIDPYHRAVARAMYAELDQLPPYADSTAEQTLLKASVLDQNSSLEVHYSSAAQCSDIQEYYAGLAPQVGWQAQGAILVLTTDSNPDHNQLDGTYQKDGVYQGTTQGYMMGLSIQCFVDSSYQGGYGLYLNVPPVQ